MHDKYGLIEKGLISISKYRSTRLGVLDIINGTSYFIPQIEGREDMGDDLKAMIRISKEWNVKDEHNVGEGGALYRFLQFASWKYDLGKRFVKEKTLASRKMCDNPDIVNWSMEDLLKLDDNTTQWASAALLMGSQDDTPDYFLDLTREELAHYDNARRTNGICEVRYDDTLLSQAESFLTLLETGQMDFTPQQPDDYCFARAFGLIDKKEGERRWPELKGHESNRLEEMERQSRRDSKDHRVVQADAEFALFEGRKVDYAFPGCVSKSWPQFWEFLQYADCIFKD